MSDWNQGSRSWYPNPNAFAWGEDPRTSYNTAPANYYPNQQYVGFNEFITQLQQNNSYPTAAYPGNTPQAYPGPPFDGVADLNITQTPTHIAPQHYQPMPSHNIPDNNSRSEYGESVGGDSNMLHADNRYFNSNLTPTATEFVPKSAQPRPAAPAPESLPASRATRTQEKLTDNGGGAKTNSEAITVSAGDDKTNGASGGNSTTSSIEKESNRKENSKGSNGKNKRKAASKAPTTEDVGRTFYNSNAGKPSGSQDIRSRNQDVRYSDNHSKDNVRDNYSRDNARDSKENNGRESYSGRDSYRERDTRDNYNKDISNRENQSRDSSTRDNSGRDARNNRDTRENNGRDGYHRESRDNGARDNYNRDNSGRDNRESNIRDRNSRDSGNRENYNSNRDNYSRDVVRDHYGRDSYRDNNQSRGRYGTQRFQRMERNADEDEQYANSYLTYREERQDGRRPVTSEKLQLVPASPARHKSDNKRLALKEENTALTQRERLSDQLDRGVLECLVCCERVKQTDQVWSCGNCYHVLHLRCIRKWAVSSMVEGKWRCPACQNMSEKIPTQYLCFCGANQPLEWMRATTVSAHSCGEQCRRTRACTHTCGLLCHPGPCPPCLTMLNKKCGCGAETRTVICSSKVEQVCGGTCGRQLACRAHRCTLPCHESDCPDCTETLSQVCYCTDGKTRVVACSSETSGAREWACEGTCGRVLACGQHVCRDRCHPPPCQPCRLLPEAVLTCPCGKMELTEKEKRTVCTEPIPLCGNICARTLACGPPNDPHFCKLECHDGPCPPCPDKTLMNCRCVLTSREVDCVELPQMIDNIFCTKKCNKKLSCGRHRCRELCCALENHRCPQVCGRMLSCGLHRCAEFCHTGHCPPCARLGFSELRCECGAAVQLPPVACGARPPLCSAPCVRARPCRHEPHHSCHPGECPPCVVLTTKRCHGGHEERKTIPCHQEEFSCGLPCGKPLPCGKHLCNKLCHKGECATSKCVQQCTEKRPGCGHACGAACHAGAGDASPCPSLAPCRLTVRATCPCKRRFAEKACADNARDFAKAMSTMVASKMQDGSAVDLSDVTRPGSNLKTLECDDECRVEARTRQMALVLQIRNPDTSSKLAPRYSEHVRQWAIRDPAFSHQVHAKLTELVQLAKKSKQKTRSHSFPSMNRQKRQFVHEMCEHFGCDSVAYDAEPNRNVVATADREKSWLPAMSIMEVLEREAGKRRVPGPVLRPAPAPGAAPAAALSYAASAAPTAPTPANNKSASGWATLTSSYNSARGGRAGAAAPAPAATPASPGAAPAWRPRPPIDYFDNPPTN